MADRLLPNLTVCAERELLGLCKRSMCKLRRQLCEYIVDINDGSQPLDTPELNILLSAAVQELMGFVSSGTSSTSAAAPMDTAASSAGGSAAQPEPVMGSPSGLPSGGHRNGDRVLSGRSSSVDEEAANTAATVKHETPVSSSPLSLAQMFQQIEGAEGVRPWTGQPLGVTVDDGDTSSALSPDEQRMRSFREVYRIAGTSCNASNRSRQAQHVLVSPAQLEKDARNNGISAAIDTQPSTSSRSSLHAAVDRVRSHLLQQQQQQPMAPGKKGVLSSAAIAHDRRHRSTGVYRCPKCSAHFYKAVLLKRHLLSIHNSAGSNKLYKCSLCDYTSDRGYNVKLHRLRRHPNLNDETSTSNQRISGD